MRIALLQEMISHGDRGVVVPISRLQELKEDFNSLRSEEDLSGFQEFIIDDLFCFDLPEVDFPIQSIILIATPNPPLARVVFNYCGKRLPLILPGYFVHPNARQNVIEEYIGKVLHRKNYHIARAFNIPFNRLAVRSGLAQFGRNNLTYIKGMGSFFSFTAFFSDVPCENSEWNDVYILKECRGCSMCRSVCPTHAIDENRLLIYADRCLTHLNMSVDPVNFPAWIPLSAHNAIIGCGRCQWICPANRDFMGRFNDMVEFTEEETEMLYEGKSPETFSSEMMSKLQSIEMDNFLSALPRNLHVLFEQGRQITTETRPINRRVITSIL